jgi:hypothetical protein
MKPRSVLKSVVKARVERHKVRQTDRQAILNLRGVLRKKKWLTENEYPNVGLVTGIFNTVADFRYLNKRELIFG